MQFSFDPRGSVPVDQPLSVPIPRQPWKDFPGLWTLPPQAGAAKVLISLKRATLVYGFGHFSPNYLLLSAVSL